MQILLLLANKNNIENSDCYEKKNQKINVIIFIIRVLWFLCICDENLSQNLGNWKKLQKNGLVDSIDKNNLYKKYKNTLILPKYNHFTNHKQNKCKCIKKLHTKIDTNNEKKKADKIFRTKSLIFQVFTYNFLKIAYIFLMWFFRFCNMFSNFSILVVFQSSV